MSHTVELPDAIFSAATAMAARRGLSIEDFLALAVSERSVLEDETERFFAEKSKDAVPGAWRAALAAVPNRPADPHDAKA